MAMRTPLSLEEMKELHERFPHEPMSEEQKIDFRAMRDKWASEGHLPEAFEPKDIEEIEAQVRTQIGFIFEKVRSHKLGGEEFGKFFKVVGYLRKSNLIGARLYEEAMEVLNPMFPRPPKD